MGKALCTTVANAGNPDCPVRHVPDQRWLVRRTTIRNPDGGEVRTRMSLSDTMPR